jgi:TATA-box binding protein (TBP) (component of TFIID and TFIIIB)
LKYNKNEWNFVQERFLIQTKKRKFNTFLVFHSGKVIMSGMTEENMNKDFQFFYKFLMENRNLIEEKIE